MLKRLVLAQIFATVLAATSFAGSIDLLSSSNATWTKDVGNATCTIGPRSSGDSLMATWTVDSGGWNNTWVSIVGTPLVSLHGADTIKILYLNNNVSGFSLRLTMIVNKDTTMWQSAYLNGLVGLQAANFPLNSTTFPQQFKTGGVFNLDSLRTISFINNTNPTTIPLATPVTGVYTIKQILVITGGASVRSFAPNANRSSAAISISSVGFNAPRSGAYTVTLYGANGTLMYHMKSQYVGGFNKFDFSNLGLGVCFAKVSGNGFAAASRLVIR